MADPVDLNELYGILTSPRKEGEFISLSGDQISTITELVRIAAENATRLGQTAQAQKPQAQQKQKTSGETSERRSEIEFDPNIEKMLRTGFDRNMKNWGELGLFDLPERAGFPIPNFEEYRPYLAKIQHLAQSAEFADQLDKGYNALCFTPTLPLSAPHIREGWSDLHPSMLQMMRVAILKKFGDSGGYCGDIQYRTKQNELRKVTVGSFQVEQRSPSDHITLLAYTDMKNWNHWAFNTDDLSSIERRNGGVLRLERHTMILPEHLGRAEMAPCEWVVLQDWKKQAVDKGLPAKLVSPQSAQTYLSFMIDFILTQGYFPDAMETYRGGRYGQTETDFSKSRRALIPGTVMMNEANTKYNKVLTGSYQNCALDLHPTNSSEADSYSGIYAGIRVNEGLCD